MTTQVGLQNKQEIGFVFIDNAENIPCDVEGEREVNLVAQNIILSGAFEVLVAVPRVSVNNAGALLNKPFLETTYQDFEAIYKTNVYGVSELTRVVLPFMKKDGHVVNISSMGGIQGSMKFPGLAAYSSSKGAVITLTELLAEEYKETGPSFNVLALGAVQTEMLEEAFPDYKAPITAEEMAEYIFNFAQNGHKYYNGKVLQVSSSTP